MSTKVERQRVLVIQDASKKLRTDAIRWTLQGGLSLKPGDQITIVRVVQPFRRRTANTSSFTACGVSLLGYKSRLHSSATIKKRQESMEEEMAEVLDEYEKSAEIKEILELNEMQQIEFKRAVEAGHSLKEVTVQAAKNLDATCVILDRQMKKDQKYILDNLSTGILRMKHGGGVERVREPVTAKIEEMTPPGKSIVNYLESSSTVVERHEEEEIFEKSFCLVCKNRRPIVGHFKGSFTYAELQFATNGFSKQNLLSSNHRGKEIYIGELSDGLKIVIRKQTPSATIDDEEFKSRVEMLRKARHENVAMLLGSCSQRHHRLLVYEYACNASLNTHLSKRSREMTWERRIKIATGTARGLEYLHSRSIYGNMRTKNILITHDYEPLVANFGFTKNQYEGSDYSSETRVLKTFEYLAPEYEETGIDSSKTDVYAFGVVLLELITGRKTIEDTNGQSFLRWARPLLEEKKYEDLIDPAVLESHDLHQLFCIVRVAEKCLCANPNMRLSIEKVVNALTCIVEGSIIKDFSPTESELLKQMRK